MANVKESQKLRRFSQRWRLCAPHVAEADCPVLGSGRRGDRYSNNEQPGPLFPDEVRDKQLRKASLIAEEVQSFRRHAARLRTSPIGQVYG